MRENGSRVKLFHSFYYHLITFAWSEGERLSVWEKPYIANRFICEHRTMYTHFSMKRRGEKHEKVLRFYWLRSVCVCVCVQSFQQTQTHRKYWKSTTIRIIIIITMDLKCVLTRPVIRRERRSEWEWDRSLYSFAFTNWCTFFVSVLLLNC